MVFHKFLKIVDVSSRRNAVDVINIRINCVINITAEDKNKPILLKNKTVFLVFQRRKKVGNSYENLR